MKEELNALRALAGAALLLAGGWDGAGGDPAGGSQAPWGPRYLPLPGAGGLSIPGPEVPCIFPSLWLRGWRPVSRPRVSGEGAGPGRAPHPAASFPSRAVPPHSKGKASFGTS